MKIDIDRFGIFASGLCAVHCLVFPLLLSFSAAGGFWTSHSHGVLEWVIFALSVVLAGTSFFYGYRRHLHLTPAMGFSIGIVMIAYGLLLASGSDHLMMGLGGLIIAAGHYYNRHLLRADNQICCQE